MIHASYEWRVFGEIPDPLRETIEALPLRFEKGGITLSDEYLWRPGCGVNAKVRNETLKFKALEHQEPDGVEIWSVLDRVWIDPSGIQKLAAALETRAPKQLLAGCESTGDLMNALGEFDPPLRRIMVEKFRTQYLFKVEAEEAGGQKAIDVSVELADIFEPVRTASICLEVEVPVERAPNPAVFEALRIVYRKLGLPAGMPVKSYLDMLEEWAG